MLCRWEQLPGFMRTEEVRPYYEVLKKHWFGLLVKRTFDFVMSSGLSRAGILPPGTGDTVWTKISDLQVSHYGSECRPNRKPGDCR